MSGRCIACNRQAHQRHHVLYRQHLKIWSGSLRDKRNLVALCKRCHEAHHQRVSVLALEQLPDSVYEFAVELMGAGPAYETLRRYYAGHDPRLDALLAEL